MPSFDIVSEVDKQEVRNALEQTNKEVSTRFDFKGSEARVEQAELLLTRDAPLLQTLPPAVSAMLDKAVDAYIPVVVDKLGAWLARSESRDTVKHTLQGVVAKFVTDLRFQF